MGLPLLPGGVSQGPLAIARPVCPDGVTLRIRDHERRTSVSFVVIIVTRASPAIPIIAALGQIGGGLGSPRGPLALLKGRGLGRLSELGRLDRDRSPQVLRLLREGFPLERKSPLAPGGGNGGCQGPGFDRRHPLPWRMISRTGTPLQL